MQRSLVIYLGRGVGGLFPQFDDCLKACTNADELVWDCNSILLFGWPQKRVNASSQVFPRLVSGPQEK